jgi:hypothetical protein
MFNIFNRSAKKEERLLPYFIDKNSSTPSDSWVTSQVFSGNDRKGKKRRVYIAAVKKGDAWEVSKYTYSTKSHEVNLRFIGTSNNLEKVISAIAIAEKELREMGNIPISGLEGNYKKVGQHYSAGVFSDAGKFTSIEKGAPVTEDVLFTPEKLGLIYPGQDATKVLEAEKALVISTWDDYYRDVVGKQIPAPGTPVPKEIRTLVKGLERKLKGRSEPDPADLYAILTDMKVFPVTHLTGHVDQALGYQYNVMVLTTLMRAGGIAYEEFSSSIMADRAALQSLKDTGLMIESFAQKGLGLAPEQARQLKDLITQGRDPHAAKPFPLQELIAANAAAEKAQKQQATQPPQP